MNSNTRPLLTLFFIASLFGCKQPERLAQNWTGFRGANLNGIAETGNIPLKWDESAIKWKTEIHDNGYSSPVVFEDQIWITTAKADGKEVYAVCADYKSGKIIYDIKVFTPEEVEGRHTVNTYATPTPCIEKGFVYVHYGSIGTACINTSDGSVIWKQTGLKCNQVHAAGSSPIIYKNLVILHFEGIDTRYITALNKSTGDVVWKRERPLEPYEHLPTYGKPAFITPIIINVKGRDMLISNGSAICQALDPITGKEIWRIVDGAETTIAMPFTENGVLYWYTGFNVADDGKPYTDLLAVNPDGAGDIAGTNIIWKKKDETSDNQMLSPLIKDGLIYTVTTRNIMMCIDAGTGEEIWSRRVTAHYNASPVYIDGNIWFFQ
ncbi:MAG: PQQ-like beta-propeller repeat protein [Bacteroidales bacterium]|nr:PQQ-like beta-propeller repeat protein [Bacteroidales bacterium]